MKTKRPRMPFPQALADIFQDSLGRIGLGERLREMEIWRIWGEAVGPAIALRAQPNRIINGVLTVVVSSGPWMQELSFFKETLKEKLNSRLGDSVIKEIVLRSGRVAVNDLSEERELPAPIKLTPDQLTRIERYAAEVIDPETRAAFAALMKASLENQRLDGNGATIINTTGETDDKP